MCTIFTCRWRTSAGDHFSSNGRLQLSFLQRIGPSHVEQFEANDLNCLRTALWFDSQNRTKSDLRLPTKVCHPLRDWSLEHRHLLRQASLWCDPSVFFAATPVEVSLNTIIQRTRLSPQTSNQNKPCLIFEANMYKPSTHFMATSSSDLFTFPDG